jgi:Uma2 family endonuclease
MKLQVVDERKEPVKEPYVVRLAGWTMERYLREAPESAVWEFVRGDVVVHSPASADHQDIVRFLLRLLDGYCEARGLGKVLTGPAAVRILPEVVREPDVFVLLGEEASRAGGVPLEVRPALVVEVASPATRSMDLGEKAEEYREARVPEYWVVDPEQKQVVLHRLAGPGWQVERLSVGRLESRSIPGFWLDGGWLFRQPLLPVEPCLRQVLGEKS